MVIGDDSLLDHAWRHFEFHAKQRLSLFNFCLIWAGLIIAAWSQAITDSEPQPIVAGALGVILAVSALVFWRMDQRNTFLTKMSESVLSAAEASAFEGGPVLFSTDNADAKLKKGLRFLFAPQWSHGQALRVLFVLMGVTGLMGTAFALAAPSIGTPRSAAITAKEAGEPKLGKSTAS